MRGSSKEDTSVFDFDFDPEDEAVELSSIKQMERFVGSRNRRHKKSSLTKDTFLKAFCPGSDVKKKEANKCFKKNQKEVNNVMCIDDVSSDGDHKCRNDSGINAVGTSDWNSTLQQELEVSRVDHIVVFTPRNSDLHGHFSDEKFRNRDLISKCLRMHSPEMGSLGVPSQCDRQLNSLLDKVVDVISDDDENLKEGSLSTSVSDPTQGALEHTALDCCSDGDVDKENKVNEEVFVFPDFVSYGGRVSTRSQLCFSSDLVKLEVYSAFEGTESSSFEWSLDDIAYIECRRSENVDITCVKLVLLRPTAVKGIENLNSSSEFSKLLLAVSDPKWEETEQMITSLAASYQSIWNPVPAEMVDEDDDFVGQQIMFFLKRYFSNFDEPFEDVIYPKGDPDAVCISKKDVELLQPATFINDTIIDFYIKYLKNKIQKEDENRFHFFNSFFFRKLADLDKDPGSALEKRAAFQRIRKWTRKVNIFEKDYIFIPVNFNLHWSLIVVCHPGEIPNFTDEGIERASRVPCILHMDSIKGGHRGLKTLFQSYLWEEWKEGHESSEDFSSRFSNMRFIPLELPQQENSFDCGLFLLHYVELFLKEAPVNFSPFKITKFNFLSPNWFPPAEASCKRSAICKLIYEIIDNQSLKSLPDSSCNQNHSKFSENDLDKEAVEFLSERHGPTKVSYLRNLLSTIFDTEVEIKQSAPSSVQFGKEMGTVSSEFCRHGNMERSYLDEQHPPSDQIASFEKLWCPRSTLEEDVENNDQVCSSSDKAGYRLPDGTMAQICSISYSFKDVGAFENGFQEIPTSLKKHGSRESSSKCSSSESTSSSEVWVHDSRDISSDEQVGKETRISASLKDCRDGPEERKVEVSPERNSMGEDVGERVESGQSFFSSPENLPAATCQEADSGKNHNSSDDDVCVISDYSEARPKQLSHKRMKRVLHFGGRRHTRSMAHKLMKRVLHFGVRRHTRSMARAMHL